MYQQMLIILSIITINNNINTNIVLYCNILPRLSQESGTIKVQLLKVQLKRRLQYKSLALAG